MERKAPSTRQRALALAALLARDRDVGPLRLLAEPLREPVTEIVEGSLARPGGELAELIAHETAALLAEPSGEELGQLAGRLPPGRPASAGLRRLLTVYGSIARGGTVPAPLKRLQESDNLVHLLSGLTTSLVGRARTGDRMAAYIVSQCSALLSRINPRLAPAVAWVGLSLAHDEAGAEALSATWPAELRAALLDAQAQAFGTLPAERALEEQNRLILELESLG